MDKFIIFNFKMAPSSLAEAKKIFEIFNKFSLKIKKHKLVIVPPYVYLAEAKEIIGKNCFLGAQNVFWFDRYSVTGEISPKMLKLLKSQYVIIGHSERREYLQETEEMINLKLKTCLKSGLKPVLCIGEKERKENDSSSSFSVKKILFEQLNYAFRGIQITKSSDLIIAYEPIWAIGSGKPQDLLEVKKMISLIRFWLARRFSEKLAKSLSIIYGGSINAQNILSFLKIKEGAGVLVGGASTNKNELIKILKQLIK
ncbi:MAG: triose-phosphate isomerase [Candidatus Pacebacteria bacterium]|jgi:triosephosphate isomerase|nr:triose-phosphate isomerase [Candidatus Paceibacterota bacterium]MDD4994567.1 triose-phosphate isomerase [Candidatus Paceibacterota bacterium]MDD5535193.1 triose-phosphate isomerase [Candidatus Paceibacterota bacterium]